jgi:beta-glucosidase
MRVLDGGWSYSWQGVEVPNFATTQKYHTIFRALRAKFGNERINYVPGTRYTDTTGQQFWAEEEVDIQKAASTAAHPNYSHIVLVLGENSYTETPGDLQDSTLSELQLRLADAVIAAAGPKKIVLVLSKGRPPSCARSSRGCTRFSWCTCRGTFGATHSPTS